MSEDISKTKSFPSATFDEIRHAAVNEQDEGVSFVDLYKILRSKKILILCVVILITLVGTLRAMLKTDVYTYSTAFKSGVIYLNGNEKLLELAKNTVIQANDLVIPAILYEYYSKYPDQKKNLVITASTPKESDFVMLSAKSSETDAELYKSLLTRVGDKIMAEQNKRVDEYKAQLSLQIINARNRIETLAASEVETVKRIDDMQKLFKTKSGENGDVTTLKLVITESFGQLQDVAREKYSLEAQVSTLETNLKLTSRSQYLTPITRSIETVNGSKIIVIIGSIIVGLVLGVFLALFMNFVDEVRAELKSSA